MTYFACFYHMSVHGAPRLIEACGDRATIILDGRQAAATHYQIATDEGRQRGYLAFRLHRGRINGDSERSELFSIADAECTA